ncbi:hypothetical protein FB451DRAFT_1468806 [Mycena latifolia]|nr:hypothetical protein FB451DRAFT_1468806 [Mycena latifolia]
MPARNGPDSLAHISIDLAKLSVCIYLFYGTAANTAEEGEHGAVFARASLHHPCLAFPARITHPRREIVEDLKPMYRLPSPHNSSQEVKSLKRKVIPSGTTSVQEGPRPKPRVQCQRDVLVIYKSWRPQVRRYATPRPPPPSADSLPYTLTSFARGVIEHLRVELAAQLVTAGARSVRVRTGGRGVEAVACAEALALTADSQPPASKPARASADEMWRAVGRERDIRVRREERPGCCAKHRRGRRRKRRTGALRAELAGAVGSGKSFTMDGGGSAVQEMITDAPPRKHEMHDHPAPRRTTARTCARPRSPAPRRPRVRCSRRCRRRGDAHERTHSVSTLRIRETHRRRGLGVRRASAGRSLLAHPQSAPPVHPAGSAGRRAREREGAAAQRINRSPSLSALSDVVAALGSGPGAHVPYSKLGTRWCKELDLDGALY